MNNLSVSIYMKLPFMVTAVVIRKGKNCVFTRTKPSGILPIRIREKKRKQAISQGCGWLSRLPRYKYQSYRRASAQEIATSSVQSSPSRRGAAGFECLAREREPSFCLLPSPSSVRFAIQTKAAAADTRVREREREREREENPSGERERERPAATRYR
ncbi:hypothetical protein GUJ93_ZPchr0007g3125 [Zizania palustris]|uniref:Uncharacterized protein n=1 Tax=Zizania palustris TaxID=103762 RepID=A0A8J5T4U5_ZIZPA|nr:hypothetical protein GUJ93_ZPchr0007g3125 [Zizania palustris]